MLFSSGNNRSRLGHGLSVAAALGHDDLGHDTDGDLGRRLGVKLQANRGRNARQPHGTQAVGQQLALRLLPAAAAAHDADVGRGRRQQVRQNLPVEVDVARDDGHIGARVNGLGDEGLGQRAGEQHIGIGHILRCSQFGAVIPGDDAVAQPVAERDQGAADVATAEDVERGRRQMRLDVDLSIGPSL